MIQSSSFIFSLSFLFIISISILLLLTLTTTTTSTNFVSALRDHERGGDHYKTLGLKKTATKQEIEDAFDRLVKKFEDAEHGDEITGGGEKDGGDGEIVGGGGDRDFSADDFGEIATAYEVLSNERSRRAYDMKNGEDGWEDLL